MLMENVTGDSEGDLVLPSYIFVYVTFLNIVVFFVGIIGNALVLLTIFRMRDMRNTMNYFLCSLSVADLLVLMICQPSAMLEFYGKDVWYLGDFLCKLIPALENFAPHCSVTILLAISCERFKAICHPLRDDLKIACLTTGRIIALIWFLVGAMSVPFAFMTFSEDAIFHDGTDVKVCRTRVYETWHYAYVITMFVIFFILPLAVLMVMYCAIIKHVTKDLLPHGDVSRRLFCSNRYRKQIVFMIIGVVVLFFVCLIPLKVLALWTIFTPQADLRSLGFEGYTNLLSASRILLYTNSAGNPVIYGLVSSRFRKAFRMSLSDCRKTKLVFNNSVKFSSAGCTMDGVHLTLIESPKERLHRKRVSIQLPTDL